MLILQMKRSNPHFFAKKCRLNLMNKDGTAYYEAPNADLGIAPAFVLGA